MKKPTPVERDPVMNYLEMIKFVEEKHNINVRDYANKFKNGGHFKKYQDETGDMMPCDGYYPDSSGKNLGFTNEWTIWREGKRVEATKEEYDADFKLIHDHYKRYSEWVKNNPEPPYLDHWHWMMENHFSDDLRNGCEENWNLLDILEGDAPEWIKEITQKVYDEFKEYLDGEGGLDVLISW